MAYALWSLVQILEQDQHKHHLALGTGSQIDSFLEKARTLRDLVESTSFEIIEDLESIIREAAHGAEDLIESYIVKQLLKEEEEYDLELTDVMEEFDSIKEQIIMLNMVGNEKVQVDLEQSPPTINPNQFITYTFYGFYRDIIRLENQLLSEQKSQLQVIPIVVIAGSGKSQLAMFLCDNKPSIMSHFDIRAWTTISKELNLRLILLELLLFLIDVSYEMCWEYDDQQLGEYLCAALAKKRYFIVLDDIWNTDARDKLRKFFPENNNGSRIILTTRKWNLADYARTSFYPHQMFPIDDDSSWSVLCEKVFGDRHGCPPELVETGFQIAKNCRGHPLTIVTIAGFLSTVGNTLDAWQRIESKQKDSANVEEEVDSINEEIHEVDPSLMGFVEFFSKAGLQLMAKLVHGQHNLQIIPVVGAGESIGKTILARLLYDRALCGQHFDVYAWVSINQVETSLSKQRNVVTTLKDLLDSLHKCGVPQVSDDDIGVCVHKTLKNRRYLIVLDDIRDLRAWDTMRRFFPDECNGSRIILTTPEWSEYDRNKPFRLDSYWEFLLGKVDTLIPTSQIKLQFWRLVEEEFASSIKRSTSDLYMDFLSMSYNTLPYHLKPCFLYIGAFPEDYEIETKRIIHMWIAEGFVRPVAKQSLEDTASMYLEFLISRKLLFLSGSDINGIAVRFKIHDVLWKFCRKKAFDEKFWWFKDDNILEDGETVRRVSVNPNCPPSNDEDEDMPFVRSFLCARATPRGLAPMFLDLRLLRVLDVRALTVFWFPQELLQLINLRYLALSCYSDLPSSISIFRNLQTLIAEGIFSVPSELWELTQLKSIQCPENCIWNVSGKGESVYHEELHSLGDIQASEVTYAFLRHNPNLRNLSIIFDDSTNVSVIPLDCLNNLEFLECSYVGSKRRYDFLHYLSLPVSLKKIIVRSCIIHSEFMTNHVGVLPLLHSLKLEKCDLVDLKWEPAEGGVHSTKNFVDGRVESGALESQ